jgi:hypothetical protein
MSIVRAEDDEALHLNTFSVAIGVAVVHFQSGIALLVNNGGLRTTPLFFLATFFHYNASPVAGIFIGTALLAIAPFLVRSPSRALFHDLCRPAAVLAPAPFCVSDNHGVDRPVLGRIHPAKRDVFHLRRSNMAVDDLHLAPYRVYQGAVRRTSHPACP